MSNQSEQKIDPLTLNQTGLYVSAFALATSAAIFMVYRPMAIIEFFFVFQMAVRYIAYYRIRTESRFIEHFWTAPMKLIVAAVMMASIPNDNVWGMVWIGVALLFAMSGARNLYKVMRVVKANQGNMSPFANTVSTSQRKKEAKIEDALVADLTEFLNRPDSDGKGK